MNRILVTGAEGFVGKHLTDKLKASGCYIVKGISRASGDITSKALWHSFSNIDTVVHLAASTFVPESWNDPVSFFETNLLGTISALEFCKRSGARLVYISSYLYGNPENLPVAESAKLVASNPYALSKKMAEEACEFYAISHNVRTIVLRPFNVYGLGQSEKFLIPSILKQMESGDRVVVQDLEPKRDYIFIEDLTDAIVLALAKNIKFQFEIFNIGTGESYSVRELIQFIQEICGTQYDVNVVGARRAGELMDTRAKITKAKEILCWTPKFNLRSGLELMLKGKCIACK